MKNDRKNLLRLSKLLDEAQKLIAQLIDNGEPEPKGNAKNIRSSSINVEQLKGLERWEVEERLAEFSQRELGEMLVHLGGGSADSKKPKIWLREQILWRLFDFERGHETIRNQGRLTD